MIRKFLLSILILLLMISFASAVAAIEGGDAKRGKVLMKNKCKVCHDNRGQGGRLTPLSKTMNQWDRFFKKDMHKDFPKGFDGFSEKDLLDINQYLYDHAADSDHPETCG